MKNRLSALLVITQRCWLLEPAAALGAPHLNSVLIAAASQAVLAPNRRYIAVEATLLAATAAYFVMGLLSVLWG